MAVKRTMYQRKVDVDTSSEQGLLTERSASPHQPYIDTLYIKYLHCAET